MYSFKQSVDTKHRHVHVLWLAVGGVGGRLEMARDWQSELLQVRTGSGQDSCDLNFRDGTILPFLENVGSGKVGNEYILVY